MKKIFILFGFIILFVACKNKQKKLLKSQNTYAKHFSIQTFDNYKILEIVNAYPDAIRQKYILTKNKSNIPDSLHKYTIINIPLNNIVVTSTTHLPALEMLHETKKLIAFPNTQYISSPVFRKMILENKIKEIGNGMFLNTEKTLVLNPELIMVFSSGNEIQNFTIFKKNHIPVVFNADWTEETPLGRAEWIKVFGVLFDKEKMADSIFTSIEKKYNSIKNYNYNNTKKPSVFQGGKFGDKWYVPGEKSYAVQLIKDAGGNYVWQNNERGSIHLNYENVLIKLTKANIWLNPGMLSNKKELQEKIQGVNAFRSYKNNRIFTYNLKKGKTGGVLYFELSNAHPDWVLEDLKHIFYPSEDNYQYHFYQKI